MSPDTTRPRLKHWVTLGVRLLLMVCFLAYASAKFLGAQFVTSGITLDRPVGELSGIELTWVYFGYSPLYSWFVALGQATAAVLLAFDRTARLGAAVLLPITVNIVVVNFGFDIGPDTQLASVVLLVLNLFLIACDLSAWKRVLWDETAADPARPRSLNNWVPTLVRVVFVLTVAGGIWWLMSRLTQENQPETPVSGDWAVVTATVDGQLTNDPALGGGWRKVCFEHHGRFGVRTDRGMFQGEYALDARSGVITTRYDPKPLPPRPLPGTMLSDDDARRMNPQAFTDYKWPVEFIGTFRLDGEQLTVHGRRGKARFEWVLTRWVRPRY